MEPIEIFAAGVLTICTLHLASAVGVHIESWWRKVSRRNTEVSYAATLILGSWSSFQLQMR